MRYTGMLFHPPGAKLVLDVGGLSPIQGHTAYTVYGQFKREMGEEGFDAKVDASRTFAAVRLRFRPVGQTAAYVAFARGDDDNLRLDAVLAVITRLDPTDDERLLDVLQANPELAMIGRGDWLAARQAKGPSAAAFFTNEHALNDPLIHGLMSLAGAAFFDRLGLLD